MAQKDPTVIKLLEEVNQAPKIRQRLIKKIERSDEFRDYRVLLFFTSFRFPVSIGDDDANIIEGILQKTDKDKNLLLIINSPGGSALAAERIINVCKSYSKDGYSVLVPKMAKSAATLITFGAEKIYMSPTSELGPIDPQIRVGDKLMSAYSIIKSYKELLDAAINTKGNVEPYLQQLIRYDPREIKELELIQDLSNDIATKWLNLGMMKGAGERKIKKKIKDFLTPEQTKVHGRAIYPDGAERAGLNVEILDPDSKLWYSVWELFIRADHVTNTNALKLVETSEQHFSAFIPSPNMVQ